MAGNELECHPRCTPLLHYLLFGIDTRPSYNPAVSIGKIFGWVIIGENCVLCYSQSLVCVCVCVRVRASVHVWWTRWRVPHNRPSNSHTTPCFYFNGSKCRPYASELWFKKARNKWTKKTMKRKSNRNWAQREVGLIRYSLVFITCVHVTTQIYTTSQNPLGFGAGKTCNSAPHQL